MVSLIEREGDVRDALTLDSVFDLFVDPSLDPLAETLPDPFGSSVLANV